MSSVPRHYDRILADHLENRRQMAFVSGPRQVGKTTSCRAAGSKRARYLDWDDQDDRALILRGPRAVVGALGIEKLASTEVIVTLDELHKYARWKTFLKGLYDHFADRVRIVVTGSSRLDVYRRGGDSLMGRYFLFRMHPFSVGELLDPTMPTGAPREPRRLSKVKREALWVHGGFPEPFVARSLTFSRRWRRLRRQQLLREDVRDMTGIQQLDQLEVFATLLENRSSEQLIYSSLAKVVNVSVDTARRWVGTLSSLHHGFLVRPWFRSVTKSLRKEPKWFLRDWSICRDPGQRAETYVACHLLKAVEMWTDCGFGDFELRYLRDKSKREVDFVVIRDDEPWFLVEVKRTDDMLSPHLAHFQQQIGAPHAFQVVLDLDFVDADCFSREDPCVVPAATLLSQLP